MMYKCILCRKDKFAKKQPHRCNGVFRKYHIVWEEVNMNDKSRKEFEKFITDYDNYDFAFITEMWQAWQEQQKKIDELEREKALSDDNLKAYVKMANDRQLRICNLERERGSS